MIKDFCPALSPIQMLKEGVFGGSYFGIEALEGDSDYSTLFKRALPDVPIDLYLNKTYITKLNKFKVKSGTSYEYWREMKWIHDDDPYGWFEWYIKYYNGRRHPDDSRQIKRWNDFCGENGWWRRRIYKMIHQTGDWDISPRIQQSLLHWGYLVNSKDFQQYKEKYD